MKILFYVEPWPDTRTPLYRNDWLRGDIATLCRCFLQFKEPCDLFFLVGDAQKEAGEEVAREMKVKLGVIWQKELRAYFHGMVPASLAWYHETATADQMEGMKSLVKDRLNGFVPDVILGWFTSMPFLRELFPDALILHGDCGFMSRPPYPYSYVLDPCGMLKNGFLAKFTKDILKETLTPYDGIRLDLLRNKFINQHFVPKNPFDREKLTRGKKFNHLLLLPLNVSRNFAFEGNATYPTQWDMVCHVLDNVPEDTGVIVTQYYNTENVLKPEVDAYLKKTYPHYIYHPEFERYPSVSQYLLRHVDAVAAVTSSLCYQALLWKKPVCALGRSQINEMADLDDIAQLSDFLHQKAYQSKDQLLYYILTRMSIPYETHYKNPEWVENRFYSWLEKYRGEGVTSSFFDPIDQPDNIFSYYLNEPNREAWKV